MSVRAGRACIQDSAFKFSTTDHESRDAIAFVSEVYQPGLRVLLDALGSDEVQDRLLRLGALRVIGDANEINRTGRER
jgi:hypothetical protein